MKLLEKMGSKLAVQLSVAIIIINTLITAIGFSYQYWQINGILLRNSEENSIDWFRQSESNINRLNDQAQMILSEIASNQSLMRLASAKRLSNADRMYYASAVLKEFDTLRNFYPYLSAITYYGEDGLILRDSEHMRNVVMDDEKTDWFYGNEAFQKDHGSKHIGWIGTYTNRDFGYTFKNESERYLVSVCIPVIGNTGTILLHYDTEYFLDTFYADRDMIDANIFAVNEEGFIVAARDTSVIGKFCEFGNGNTEADGIVRYVNTSGRTDKQIIEYTLDSIGWKLISETNVTTVTKDSIALRNVLLFTCFVSIIFTMSISVYGISRSLKPLNNLASEMKKVGAGELGRVIDHWPNNEIGIIIMKFNQMSRKLEELFSSNKRVEQERREQEMAALRAQINPHFIYNTLNNIKWMAVINNETNIARSITLLANYLEPRFRQNASVCTVKEEIESVENYIAIMNMRNGNKYTLDVQISEELFECRMIHFLLQPIIENSIIHGFENRPIGRLMISMKEEDGCGIIRVEDDGKGIDPAKLEDIQRELEDGEIRETHSIGIANIHRRVQVFYGDGYGVAVSNREGGGAVVEVRFKIEQSHKNQEAALKCPPKKVRQKKD